MMSESGSFSWALNARLILQLQHAFYRTFLFKILFLDWIFFERIFVSLFAGVSQSVHGKRSEIYSMFVTGFKFSV